MLGKRHLINGLKKSRDREVAAEPAQVVQMTVTVVMVMSRLSSHSNAGIVKKV